MRLVTIDEGVSGAPGAILKSGNLLNLQRAGKSGCLESWVPNTLRAILAAGKPGLETVQRIIDRVESSDKEQGRLQEMGAIIRHPYARLLAPIPEPRLVLGTGLNYRSHLAEMAGTPMPMRPTGFIKIGSSVIGTRKSISIPPQASAMVDWEGEVACVVGRKCHNVTEEEAFECIVGYTIVNDVSARDWVKDVFSAKEVWEGRLTWELNLMGKQFAGFTSIGPAIVTADEIVRPNDLVLETRLNGKQVQHANTGDLLFGFAQTLSFFSRWYTFSPGDIITTGTPAGVGLGREPPTFMKAGDKIEVEVSHLGILENDMV